MISPMTSPWTFDDLRGPVSILRPLAKFRQTLCKIVQKIKK
ncbi:hypothetical protein RchiOBHm_Chr3g0490241 [Rosa chinensis]|uniref:Uncharacterized protein n=1 Tax=Rosa chinensis TaxID=74649 RepID=A0A2P6RFY9_ROSCH|nr:hypothetical protein RchiOBHm_Chr3g0490241 [Rosa chinensis]